MWQQQLRSAGGPSPFDDYAPGRRRAGRSVGAAVLEEPGPAPRSGPLGEGRCPRRGSMSCTVPPPGSPATLLLERYCSVSGGRRRAAAGRLRRHPATASLGRVEAELLRRVNAGLPADRRRPPPVRRCGQGVTSPQRVLGGAAERAGPPAQPELRALVPRPGRRAGAAAGRRPGLRSWSVTSSGPAAAPATALREHDPTPVDDAAVADAAVAALVTMLDERMGRLQRRQQRRGAGARVRHSLRRGGLVGSARGVVRRLVRRFR